MKIVFEKISGINNNYAIFSPRMIMMILEFCKEAKSVPEIMEQFSFESRTSFRRKYLNDLVETGQLKMTMPDKPKSKYQKYYS